MSAKNIIDIQDLTVKYGQTIVLNKISCQIKAGDFIGLVGPNGGGKTTLIKTILGLLPANSGVIKLFDQPISNFKKFNRIGYLPQKQTGINPLFPASAEEIILLGLLAEKNHPKIIMREDWKKVDIILNDLNIAQLKGRLFYELSGGQQQKILLARALISQPELLILDEPSTALDPISREQFFTYLKDLNKKIKTTIILITHDTGYVGKYANKLLYIDHQVVFFGKITDFCPAGEISSCFEKTDHHIIWHQH